MIDYEYINSVLAKFEGRAYARAYIPCKGGTYYGGAEPLKGEPLGASGVTVATGVDLGQQSRSGLSDMGISEGTLNILQPYLGRQKQKAVDVLKEAPLTLTAKQVEEIDNAVHKHYIYNTARMFGWEKFITAPKQVQAVATSLHYQFGKPARNESPCLKLAWELMRSRDYKSAAVALMNTAGWSKDHQQYMARRKQEAALLWEIA